MLLVIISYKYKPFEVSYVRLLALCFIAILKCKVLSKSLSEKKPSRGYRKRNENYPKNCHRILTSTSTSGEIIITRLASATIATFHSGLTGTLASVRLTNRAVRAQGMTVTGFNVKTKLRWLEQRGDRSEECVSL